MADAPLGGLLRRLRSLVGPRQVPGSPDRELLDRFILYRDESAFAALVDRHGAMVLGVCRRVLGNCHDAEDASQATFLVLARKAGSITRRDSLGSWLHGVAYRVAHKLRGRARRQSAEDIAAVDLSDPGGGSELSWREALAVLDEELGRLPASYRAALVSCYLQGRTQDEAARELGWSLGALRGRLERAREKLRLRLLRRGVGLPAALLGIAVAGPAATAGLPPGLALACAGAAAAVPGKEAAGVAAHVVELAEGMVQAMVMTRTQAVFALVLVAGLLGAGALGIAAATGGDKPATTQREPDEKGPDGKEDVAAQRRQSKENLTKLGTAVHEYHSVHDRFPPPALSGKDGKPLLSWRVLILPYLGHKDLYRQFKLDEPWDSPDNKKLLDRMPAVYAPVRGASRGRPVTYYQVFAGKGTMFEGPEGVRLRDIIDGTVATVMIVEAAQAVPWTKPDDPAYAADRPLPKLGGLFKEGFHLVTGDGFCRFVKKDIDEKLLHALITRGGGELVDFDALGR